MRIPIKKDTLIGAVDVIYNTLKTSGLNWDEGPDIGGKFGPYIQSKRVETEIYKSYAEELIKKGLAYYCFCSDCKTDEDQYKEEFHYSAGTGYNGHCRNLSKEDIEKNLNENKPYVIRQKIPKDVKVKYHDEVYGDIEFNSNDLDDQVLIKQDGYPTYNFANVVDDHLMKITDVVRGSEYLSSTPKYVLLYQAFDWDVPRFIHLPLINGRDKETGEVSKLSKRHGSTAFNQLIDEGYLGEAIINYIAFLGWNPKTNDEIFSLNDLIKTFKISGLHKSPAIFDYDKLNSINQYYIANMSDEDFYVYGKNYILELENINWLKISKNVKCKIKKFSELHKELKFIIEPEEYNLTDLITYKNKVIDKDLAIKLLNEIKYIIISDENHEELLKKLAETYEVKFGLITWLVRVSLSGKKITILDCIGCINAISNDEKIKRIDFAIERLKNEI